MQNDLFDVGADLSCPVVPDPEHPQLRVGLDYVERLERWCDHYNQSVAPLRSFILRGGTPAAAAFMSRAPSRVVPSARRGLPWTSTGKR